MKIKFPKLPEKLAPYRGVIGFAIILMVSNVLWKYNVLGDESNTIVTLWGWDISAPFIWMARHVAVVSVAILNFLDFHVTLDSLNVVQHDSGYRIQVIWACSGLKQAYICFCILAFSHGPWLKKLWYVPLSLLVVYLFNIFRITFIIGFVEQHPAAFDFLHLYLFKYLFYGIIFAMWVYWEEKIAVKKG
jgi:exosortase/archaeosortase family protein